MPGSTRHDELVLFAIPFAKPLRWRYFPPAKKGTGMTGIEAGADIATGALIARAVEPAGDHAGHDDHDPGACLNCGTALIGTHCHACGQAGHVHRTLGAIGHDIAHGVFHFDGKIWRTLPMLALHPGDLTRRYIAGERMRFVSPLAIFLFAVFLMFAIVASLPGWHVDGGNFLKPGVNGGIMQARVKLAEEDKRAATMASEARAKLAKEQRKAEPDQERITTLQQRITRADEAVHTIGNAQKALGGAPGAAAAEAPLPDENWFEARMRHARENPELLLYKMKNSAYKYSWALIPISLPFIWFLFPFSRRYGPYDHAVFTTYSLTFMSLLTVVLAVLGAVGIPEWMLWTAAGIIPPIHIYKQLKGAYRLNRLTAGIRTALLSMMIVCGIIPIFAVLLVYMGVG